MLLCVLAEAYPALNMHTMHHAHLLSIASFFAEFYTFVASLILCVSHFNTTQKKKHSTLGKHSAAYVSFLYWLHLDS